MTHGGGFLAGVERFTIRPGNQEGAGMARVAEHLSVAELQAGYRGSKAATLDLLRFSGERFDWRSAVRTGRG